MSSNASDSIVGKYYRFGKLKVERRSSRRAKDGIAPNDAADLLIPRTQESLYRQGRRRKRRSLSERREKKSAIDVARGRSLRFGDGAERT